MKETLTQSRIQASKLSRGSGTPVYVVYKTDKDAEVCMTSESYLKKIADGYEEDSTYLDGILVSRHPSVEFKAS